MSQVCVSGISVGVTDLNKQQVWLSPLEKSLRVMGQSARFTSKFDRTGFLCSRFSDTNDDR